MIRDIPEKIPQKKNSNIQKKEKKEKKFPSVKKTVIPEEMNMVIINTEIEILKIKIVYRRKITIFQKLRRKNADEKSKFYIIIEGNILSVFKKRMQFFSTKIFFFQRFKTNSPSIYNEINLKNYNNYIKRYNLYFKDYARVFITELEKVTHTIIFTESTPQNKLIKLDDDKKSIIWGKYCTYMKTIMADPENRKLLASIKLKTLKQKFNQSVRNLLYEFKLIEADLSYKD
jgi:hypothetical protein